ncbi:RNA-binding (RRM/RBD/RNP motifs) family protein [Striga asiatica]|uniref:Splicing factor 3B subunit 4 n=1 Tax=Striga asiatica TaxID=4170 RepID=A0A5A7RF31_STRAF|nr:RNA-binding (RRM/RBD/RNP motifs) family protein [Striga asiatica]
MTTRIAPGVGANLLGQHSAERNQDATVYVGNLEPKATEEILWELFVQAGPVVNVYVPKDRVTNAHQGYGFVEFRSEEDADYAIKVLNMIKLYGKAIRVNKASQDKKSVDVGANLFIGNLDPDVDEKLLYDTFSAFGVIVTNPKIMRDPETGNSRGFGFISYDSFDASDAAIETMNGQYLCNRQITVSYAYKKDTKGEQRLLAANSSNNAQRSRPHTMFASGPPTQQMFASGPPAQPNGTVVRPPFANGTVPSPPIRMPPPPPQSAYQQLWRPPPPPQQLGGGGPHPMHQQQQPPMMMHMAAQPPPQQMGGGGTHPMMHMGQPPPPPPQQQLGGGPHPMQQQQPMMMHMTQPPPQQPQ